RGDDAEGDGADQHVDDAVEGQQVAALDRDNDPADQENPDQRQVDLPGGRPGHGAPEALRRARPLVAGAGGAAGLLGHGGGARRHDCSSSPAICAWIWASSASVPASMSSSPVARNMISASVGPAGSSPAIWPLRITMMRSLMPITSGSSEEIISTATPSLAS